MIYEKEKIHHIEKKNDDTIWPKNYGTLKNVCAKFYTSLKNKRIELYMHGKCSCCSSFHIMSYKRKSFGFNINKIKEKKFTMGKKYRSSFDLLQENFIS